MPLVKPLLESQILAAFKKMQSSAVDTEAAQKDLAKELATAIDSYIKSATIIIPPGIVVATAGTPAAQTGASTAPSPPATIA